MSDYSRGHWYLQKYAKNLLLQKGHKENEIIWGYTVRVNNKKRYYIDIVGINKQGIVFIECGHITAKNKKCREEKVEFIKKRCDVFIHLSYEILDKLEKLGEETFEKGIE